MACAGGISPLAVLLSHETDNRVAPPLGCELSSGKTPARRVVSQLRGAGCQPAANATTSKQVGNLPHEAGKLRHCGPPRPGRLRLSFEVPERTLWQI